MFSRLRLFFAFASFSLLSATCCFPALSQEKDSPVLAQKEAGDKSLPYSGLSTLELKKAAEQGDFEAAMRLARFWLSRMDNEEFSPAEVQEAVYWATHWLRKAGETGHPAPQFHLKKLEPEANADWFDSLKDLAGSCDIRTGQGDMEAIFPLMEYFGSPEQQQFDHWVSVIREKASKGDSQAGADLSRLLFLYPEFQSHECEALTIALSAARQGNTDGMTIAGKILLAKAKNSHQKELDGVGWLTKAAEQGHLEATETLVCLFSEKKSRADEADSPEARENVPDEHLCKDLLQALCNRGQIHILTARGKELVEKNIDAPGGLSMLVRAADQGGFTALDLLATYYEDNGYNVPESSEKSLEYASRLAEFQGINGLLKMAAYYERGFGVEKNDQKAFEYVKKAMTLNMPKGIIEYARFLMKGIGTAAQPQKAFSLLHELEKTESSEPSLHFMMGYMYEEGIGTEKDLSKALIHYTEGAEKGDTRAMNNLASMYELGSGTPKDLQKAAEWYLQAAKRGNQDAIRNMKKINLPLKSLLSKQS